ncbi:MAG: GNAT family N-acetyltransferase [Actinomycetia bacterium]|nr:GNAT family N-acetyltransferase [Actinomycetes bacterium]
MSEVEPVPPAHWEADAIAADGGTFHVRPIRPSDADAFVAFHEGLSERTRYLRYFSAYPRIPEKDLYRFTHVDHHDRVALIALLGAELIAVGLYEREAGTDDAEVAFVVADAHHGRGIGSVLLEHLAAAARECGLRRFTAVVLAENRAMMGVFRDAGYQVDRHIEYGEVNLHFDVGETAVTERVMREREQRAEARSIRRLLFPTSVAVVGASNDPDKVGHAVFGNLLRMGFNGTLYPVNPDARHVAGVRAHASVLDVPDDIDLAVIAVPAPAVGAVAEQCAAKGVHGLVVISGGFGEHGEGAEREAGVALQRALIASARSRGMRVVGPNCLGMINTAESVRLNASLAPLPPLAGRAGFFCQSGALGVAVLGEATRRGIGVSTFVSAGNRADVSGNDLLQYWESDDDTDIALLYLESFGNPRKFARLARRLGRRKPIVAVKSTREGVVPGLVHTSAEIPEASVQALFESSGVIRVDTLGDLFDVAQLLVSQPLPAGDRVAVVGNSTALGVMVENSCIAERLSLAGLVDVGVDARPEAFGAAVAETIASDDVDALIAVFVQPMKRAPSEAYARALRAAVAGSGKPTASTFLGFEGIPTPLDSEESASPRGCVPSFTTPERAVRALARAVRYAAWRQRPASSVPQLAGADPDRARELVAGVLREAADGRALTSDEASALLACYGIDVMPAREVHGLAEACAAAVELGGMAPVGDESGGGSGAAVERDALSDSLDEVERAARGDSLAEVERAARGDSLAEVEREVRRDSLGEVERAARRDGPSAGWRGAAVAAVAAVAVKVPGAVRLHLSSVGEVAQAWESLGLAPDATASVQTMAPRGVDVVFGVRDDRSFGALVSFGVGGLATDLLGDRGYAIVPLTAGDAEVLIHAPKAYALLDGYGGGEPVAVPALTEVACRLSALADDLPELAELSLAAVATPSGVFGITASAQVAPSAMRADTGPRRMRGL